MGRIHAVVALSTGLAALCGATGIALGGEPYPRAGWTTGLTSFAHGVGGRVTIVDENTLYISSFYYDGGGLQGGTWVCLGAADTTQAFIDGIHVGPDLQRPGGYLGETLILDLPEGMTLDGWNAVSIWCEIIAFNFGSGTFAPPTCPGDVNGDGFVNSIDMAQLLGAWGTDHLVMDINHNGTVNAHDLANLLGDWGVCP